MGNSAHSNTQPQRPPESRFTPQIIKFLELYARHSGEELREWVTQTYAEQFNSVSYLKSAVPTYRRNREELIQALNKAHEGRWFTRLLQITHVSRSGDREVVKYKYVMTFPNSAEVFFDCEATFEISTGLWVQSIHHQFIPEPVAPRDESSMAGRCWRWYISHVCSQAQVNMKKATEVLEWNSQRLHEDAVRAENQVEYRTVKRNGVTVQQSKKGYGTWKDGY